MKFITNVHPNEAIKILIARTVLGSNGARYRHINPLEQLHKLDNPLYFSLLSNEQCLGNITLCQRNKSLYLRYFTFHPGFQASINPLKKSKPHKSILKNQINEFFNSVMSGQHPSIYAYIEPENIRSLALATEFDFTKQADITMFHFSRRFPKTSNQFKILTYEEAIPFIRSQFCDQTYYFENPKSGVYAGWFIHNKLTIIARFHTGCWEIQSLKGRFGKVLLKIIPWIPVIKKLIAPAHHKFAAFDSFLSLNSSIDSKAVNDFLTAGLAHFQVHHMMHWVDENSTESQYIAHIRWGLLHKILGKASINLVVKGDSNPGPYFIDAMDML